eukprot:gene10215-11901_t
MESVNEDAELVLLNVGGYKYTTTKQTLRSYADSYLGVMFSGRFPLQKDKKGRVFIDRDGDLFKYILSFLRSGSDNVGLPSNISQSDSRFKQIIYEFQYFGLLHHLVLGSSEPFYHTVAKTSSKYKVSRVALLNGHIHLFGLKNGMHMVDIYDHLLNRWESKKTSSFPLHNSFVSASTSLYALVSSVGCDLAKYDSHSNSWLKVSVGSEPKQSSSVHDQVELCLGETPRLLYFVTLTRGILTINKIDIEETTLCTLLESDFGMDSLLGGCCIVGDLLYIMVHQVTDYFLHAFCYKSGELVHDLDRQPSPPMLTRAHERSYRLIANTNEVVYFVNQSPQCFSTARRDPRFFAYNVSEGSWELLPEPRSPKILHLFINGTPGIGKSMFGLFLIYQCQQQQRSVIYHNRDTPEIFDYFSFDPISSNPTVSQHPIRKIDSFLPRVSLPQSQNLWYITDGLAPKHLQTSCVSILIASPNDNLSRNFLKISPEPLTLYMPLWSITELLAAREEIFPNIDVDRVKMSYCMAGGSARLAFSRSDILDLKKRIVNAINSTNFDQCWRAIGSYLVPSQVIHMDVDQSYKSFTSIFASRWISMQVLILKLINTSIPLENYFDTPDHSLYTISGQLYEAYVIRSLMSAKELSLIPFNDGIQPIHINSPGESQPFSSITEWISPHILYVPLDKSFPAIDLLLTPGCLFRITKAKAHKPLPIADMSSYVQRLRDLHNPYNSDPLKVYLISVVPKDVKEYQKPLMYNNLQGPSQDYEAQQGISQWRCVVPYPNIQQLRAIVPVAPQFQTPTSPDYTPGVQEFGIHNLNAQIDIDPSARCQVYENFDICRGRLANPYSIYVPGGDTQLYLYQQLYSLLTFSMTQGDDCYNNHTINLLCNQAFKECIDVPMDDKRGTSLSVFVSICRDSCEVANMGCGLSTDCDATDHKGIDHFPSRLNQFDLSPYGLRSIPVKCLGITDSDADPNAPTPSAKPSGDPTSSTTTTTSYVSPTSYSTFSYTSSDSLEFITAKVASSQDPEPHTNLAVRSNPNLVYWSLITTLLLILLFKQ